MKKNIQRNIKENVYVIFLFFLVLSDLITDLIQHYTHTQ